MAWTKTKQIIPIMKTTKYFGIFLVVALVFLASCTASLQNNQMPRGMMGQGATDMPEASKIVSFERSTSGLRAAQIMEAFEIANGQRNK